MTAPHNDRCASLLGQGCDCRSPWADEVTGSAACWWRRWKVQGFLTRVVTGDHDHSGYAPAYFFTERSAVAFRRRLYRDHGPGMVRVEVTRVR